MPGWNHTGRFKEKMCKSCGEKFSPRSGVHKFCSEACGKTTGRLTTGYQYQSINGNWRRYLNRLRHGGRAKDLTVEQLLVLLDGQGGLCALSGVELTCQLQVGDKTQTNASIDRIKAGGPYTIDNVRLICAAVNVWRSDLSDEDYVGWCRKIVEKADGKKGAGL